MALPEDKTPLDVVYHDGIDGEVNSMLGVQLDGDTNVNLLTINAAESADHAFSVHPNLVDVGGVPSKLDFVQTRKDGGLRLAALVPTKQAAKLIDPSSGVAQEVPLHAAFTQIRRITNDVSEQSGEDIALLYGEATNTIAFWRLGITTGTPYHSIEAYDIGIKVGHVFDIPNEQSDEFADRRILRHAGFRMSFNLNFCRRSQPEFRGESPDRVASHAQDENFRSISFRLVFLVTQVEWFYGDSNERPHGRLHVN